ncbi:beta-N-acetylglucosaminidase domain-containing protein [Sphingomonas sp. 179-A 2A2 NHS]|uniref:beta-N-acetylglucosaminidase domain-containing protein n=1 Tax=Sphingomonas sp. 179-A 2A2 NHS TaxID=3374290 RepID=UPI0038794602
MTPELGIIEGRFGRPWSWAERTAVMATLGRSGYRFYHYGPKADRHLRRDWREEHPVDQAEAMAAFSAECRRRGVRFGIALTPMGATHPFGSGERADIARRLAALDAIGIDDLAILFDDLRGDMPELAQEQAALVNYCAERTGATRVYFCPTYYSDDPVLDRVFGERPPAYLAQLGRRLDPAIRVYWTGEEVCAREIGVGHLERVAGELGRPVCLWDNYPVNDGSRMSRFLHLRAFTGRPAAIGARLSGHAINPAMQPLLTCIPALTLVRSYREGTAYAYGEAFLDAAREIAGEDLAAMLRDDLPALQDVGLDRLGERREALRARYAGVEHPAAAEVVRWLDGVDLVTDDEVRTQ